MSPDAAWTAYILALVLAHGPSAYLRIREFWRLEKRQYFF
jgi:hypothetical protein